MKYIHLGLRDNLGIALPTIIISVVALTVTAAITTASLFGFFSKKNRVEDSEVVNIKDKVKAEISSIDIPSDRDELYDFEIENILKKYGKVNYTFWGKKIKNLELDNGKKIDIKDLYSGKIRKSSAKDRYNSGLYSVTAKVNTPKLGKDMVGVYWSSGEKNNDGTYKASETSTNIEVTSKDKEFSSLEWYNYVDGSAEGKGDIKISRWANAKNLKDGSYFVWIPRFEYKMTNEHTNQAGIITVNFIDASQVQPSTSGYKIHPAFTNGNGNYDKGEWDDEIPGFWIAKYEMGMETSLNNKQWKGIEAAYIRSSKQGNRLTTDKIDLDGNKVYIRGVSKPNYYSWNCIGISNAYTNSKLYDEKNQSHLIKNSEWGAVAYLAHSQFGRNSNKVGMNTFYYNLNGFSKLTGFGSASNEQVYRKYDENTYKGSYGMGASTTGNLYGVYDMNGANWEYVAAYFSDNSNVKKYGKSLIEETNSSTSTKYVTIYPGEKASISSCYGSWDNIYGDAIYETSKSTGLGCTWFYSYADGDTAEKEPFILRGGSFRDGSLSGIFAFRDDTGVSNYQNNGYRVVLIAK